MTKCDYNDLMKKQIEGEKEHEKLLLHVCCAPCTSGVLDRLKKFDVTLYYFNPNTYPESEYDLRFKQFEPLNKKYADKFNIVKENYNHNEFLNKIEGFENEKENGKRCEKCIEFRLRKSFEYAKSHGFNLITTSLTISPHKNADFINEMGMKLEKEYGIKFLIADFKKENGFKNSIDISKSLGLYRQDYCGCEFSIKKEEH